MNILPKKSWHVRNKDNIAKVRRDEEEAAKQEKQKLQQIGLAEQEARTKLLRKKARKHQTDVSNTSTSVVPHKPINFFQKLGPDGQPYSMSATNTEHEKEKQQEKEKAEKKLGILTYLGQSAVETLGDDEKPWYFKPPSRNEALSDKELTKSQIVDNKRKASLDPLNEIKEHLIKKKKKHKHEHKHHKSSKSHSTHHHKQINNDSTTDKLAKLRKERMEREAKEKQRSLQLLQKHYGSTEIDAASSTSSFAPKFSNQFNPHLARNNKYT